ncbi:MAG: hypothetical protein HY952_01925 [Elusimicrobia bacterium]|nr:hypothetical protein [Elusimicrobiota bacterium]
MKAIIGYVLFLAGLTWLIVIGEGWPGMKPFMMVETLRMVLLGTAVTVVFSFPFKTLRESIELLFSRNAVADKDRKNGACDLFHAAADSGLVTGFIVTLWALITLFLSTKEGIAVTFVKTACALTALLYGFLLYVLFGLIERQVKFSRIDEVKRR